MSKRVYQVWCEYDIGQEFKVFEDKELAEDWAEEALNAQSLDGFKLLEAEGLAGIENVTLVTREIHSRPFGGVTLTGEAAAAFRKQFLGEDVEQAVPNREPKKQKNTPSS